MACTLLEPHGHRADEIKEGAPDGPSHRRSPRHWSHIPFAEAAFAEVHHVRHGEHTHKPEE